MCSRCTEIQYKIHNTYAPNQLLCEHKLRLQLDIHLKKCGVWSTDVDQMLYFNVVYRTTLKYNISREAQTREIKL